MKVTTGEMEAKARQSPNREWFYRWWPQTVALPSSFLPDSSLVLCSARVLVTTGSMRRYHRESSSFTMAHSYVRSQEGLLCLPAQTQEHGGDTRRPAVTWGELDRAVEGHQPSSRTSICFFMRGGTGGALPEPYKMTSSRILVSYQNCQKQTRHEGPTTSSGLCAHSPALCHSIAVCQRAPELAGLQTGAPFSSQMWASSHWAHVTGVKESGEAVVNIVLPCNIVQHDWFGAGSVMVWEAYPWRVEGSSIVAVA